MNPMPQVGVREAYLQCDKLLAPVRGRTYGSDIARRGRSGLFRTSLRRTTSEISPVATSGVSFLMQAVISKRRFCDAITGEGRGDG